MKNVWIPKKDFIFPILDTNTKKNLRFQYTWLERFPWLVYSKKEDGAYCRYCVVFANYGGIGNQPLGQLVLTVFRNFKKALKVIIAFNNL